MKYDTIMRIGMVRTVGMILIEIIENLIALNIKIDTNLFIVIIIVIIRCVIYMVK